MKMEAKHSYVTFLLLFIFCTTVESFLDMEELRNINYGIDILNIPVLLSTQDANKPSDTIDVTSKHGQTYRCTIPNQVEAEKQKEEEEKIAMETGVPELLKAMESGPCLFKTRDWWSYEFCYGKHVRQFHMEDGRIVGNVIMLGYYESEFDWKNETNMEIKSRNKNRLNRYHSQQYINGSKCDLTGKARKTEVRFLCEEGSGDFIGRLDEPETCSYVMTIHTTKICHHPYLKLPTYQKPVPITCNPAVSEEVYQGYLKEEEEKKILKEKLAEEQRIEKELRDAEVLFKSDEKVIDSKVQKEMPLPDSVKKSDNSRTFEFKDVSDLDAGQDMSKIEKLISAGLKDDLVTVSDQLGGQDVDMKMKVKVITNMDDLEDMLNEAQAEVENLIKKKRKEDKESAAEEKEITSEGEDKEEEEEEEEKQKDTTLKFEKKSITEKIEDTVSDIDKELDDVDERVHQSFKDIQDDEIDSVREELTKNRNNLASIKESLRKTMENEFGDIIEEAEKETGIEVEDRKGAHKELSKTLNKLVERLDKTEKDILNVDEELEKLSKRNDNLQKKMDEELDDMAKGPSKTEKSSSKNQPATSSSSSSSPSSSSKDRIKIRVTKLNKGEFQKNSLKSTTQTQKLEEDVQAQLQKAGLDLGNGKIQVKIITTGYVDDKDDVHLLSSEDTSAFKNMIVSILGGDDEAAQEEAKHSELETNYNKVWGKDRKKSHNIP